MGRVAFVFSGQGDQYPGMGRALYDKFPAAAAVFDLCDRIRPGTAAQCFGGTEAELRETKNTQPCLFAMELAAVAALQAQGIVPDAVAGFSLGEVVAATVAGTFDHETGFRLVCRRGELMQAAAEQCDAAMAAVVKLTPEQVQTLCAEFSDVWPVNFNCPGQITVSGLAAQMPSFSAAVRAAGGRAIPLKVRGGFHSPLMTEAARAFAGELTAAELRQPALPLYSNRTAAPYTEDVATLLSEQICSPVRWEDLIRNMIADGVDTFIEIGPGSTLTNMIKKIDGAVSARTLEEVLPC
ncbi:MAG: ACP S-malonyltransferase [Oscillospiraceae bacterium]|nr:ACP S-malonyltransferase [Oscillospiraceae bacterium]